MPVDVLSEIVIERPCARVAAYAADPSHAPDWYVTIDSVEWLTPPPVRVGSRQPQGTGGTRMTLRNRGAPSGFAKLAEPVLAAAMARANRKDLTALKNRLEGDGG